MRLKLYQSYWKNSGCLFYLRYKLYTFEFFSWAWDKENYGFRFIAFSNEGSIKRSLLSLIYTSKHIREDYEREKLPFLSISLFFIRFEIA